MFSSNCFIVIEARPLHTVTRRSFRLMLLALNPRVKPLSKNRLRQLIAKEFRNFKKSVREILGKVSADCLTADIWSGRNRGFLGVTAHWIDFVTLKRYSAPLACQRFKGIFKLTDFYDRNLLHQIFL